MKILFLSTNADLAGAPCHVENLANSFLKNAEISAYFGEDGPVSRRLMSVQGINVGYIPGMKSALSPLRDIKSAIDLIKIIKRERPSIVHLHSSKAGMIGRIACLFSGVPWVYTVHGWGWRGFSSYKKCLILVIEFILARTPNGIFIFVSKSVADAGVKKLKIHHQNGLIVYNGVPDVGYVKEVDTNLLKILMVARVSSAKDHGTLVKAFEILNFRSQLILCGGGTDTSAFINKVRDWAPNRFGDIIFMGEKSDVKEILRSSNIFVLSSNFEGLPISIIEAMRAGRAIVATNVGGVCEMISHGEDGLLARPGSVLDLVDHLDYLSDFKVRSRIGSCARVKFLNLFNNSKMTSAIWDIYMRICSDEIGKAGG
jgi:glycosyltransferase involved in cell wall biosynthesis